MLLLCIIGLLLSTGCRDIYDNSPQPYQAVLTQAWNNSYYAESQEPNYEDNIIYNDCLEVHYSYCYRKNDSLRYFKQTNSSSDWEFITHGEMTNGVGAKTIRLTVSNPSEDFNNPPQSTITYDLLSATGDWLGGESTGVIENHKNIIIHNPRVGFFRAAFSSPWPAVKFPISEHKSWEWSFSYDSRMYGDERLLSWDGVIRMEYKYKYIGEEVLDLRFGSVQTSVFSATGTSGTINNRLIYHFNTKLGFVKLEFITSDGAVIILEAINYRNKCE